MAELVVTDLDDTLVIGTDGVNEPLAERLRRKASEGYEVVIVSGRSDSRLDETRQWLDDNDIPHFQIHLSDFPAGPNASREFKLYKAQLLLDAGHTIEEWWENDTETRAALSELGIDVRNPAELTAEERSKAMPDFTAPTPVREEAQRGLDWREEYGRGGTLIGVARARDLVNGRNLSIETIRRMLSYFARHEIDKQGTGWSPGEDGYPSAGRIAWALWGGDPGRSWARSVDQQYRDELENTTNTRTGKAMQVKRLNTHARFEIKAATEASPTGEVVAVVSVFNNTDLVGERVMPGAFSKSLEQYASTGRSIPFVWSHQWDNPDYYIGAVREAYESDEGLVVRAELFDSPTAKHIKTLMKEGVVTEFSFAYDIIQEAEGSDGVRELTELHILEVGPTLKGANPATRLVGVRAASLDVPTASSTDAKAGRTLSSKNESRIQDAVKLLTDVLGSLTAESDTSKSEEPMVKDEAKVEASEATPTIDAATAHLLLEIETEIE